MKKEKITLVLHQRKEQMSQSMTLKEDYLRTTNYNSNFRTSIKGEVMKFQ